MRIGIVGSRTYPHMWKVRKLIDTLDKNDDVVVTGGAIGVDSMAEKYARMRGLNVSIYYPDFDDGYNVSKYHVRNEQIAKISDKVYAFALSCMKCKDEKVSFQCDECDNTYVNSKGTQSTIKFCIKHNTPLEVIN